MFPQRQCALQKATITQLKLLFFLFEKRENPDTTITPSSNPELRCWLAAPVLLAFQHGSAPSAGPWPLYTVRALRSRGRGVMDDKPAGAVAGTTCPHYVIPALLGSQGQSLIPHRPRPAPSWTRPEQRWKAIAGRAEEKCSVKVRGEGPYCQLPWPTSLRCHCIQIK